MGVMCWKEGVWEMIRAAEFWTSWNLWRDFWGETKEERITIVDTGGDKAINKNRGGVGGEGGTEAIYVTKMEVGSAGGDVDMGFEGE